MIPDAPAHVVVDRVVAYVTEQLGPLTPAHREQLTRVVYAAHRQRQPPTEPVPALSRPDGTDLHGRAARVAAAYRIALQHGHNPVQLLADAAGVPVHTVRTWVRDARRLGALGPGTQGRASL